MEDDEWLAVPVTHWRFGQRGLRYEHHGCSAWHAITSRALGDPAIVRTSNSTSKCRVAPFGSIPYFRKVPESSSISVASFPAASVLSALVPAKSSTWPVCPGFLMKAKIAYACPVPHPFAVG